MRKCLSVRGYQPWLIEISFINQMRVCQEWHTLIFLSSSLSPFSKAAVAFSLLSTRAAVAFSLLSTRAAVAFSHSLVRTGRSLCTTWLSGRLSGPLWRPPPPHLQFAKFSCSSFWLMVLMVNFFFEERGTRKEERGRRNEVSFAMMIIKG